MTTVKLIKLVQYTIICRNAYFLCPKMWKESLLFLQQKLAMSLFFCH